MESLGTTNKFVLLAALCAGLAGCGAQQQYETLAPIGTGNGVLASGGAQTAYTLNETSTGYAVSSYSVAHSGNASNASTLALPPALGPTAFAVDPKNGTLYVGGLDYSTTVPTPKVLVFAAGSSGNTAASRVIVGTATASTFDEPISMTVDQNGLLYIASTPQDTAAVTVYAANAAGQATPMRVLSGPSTGMYNPTQLVVDKNGTIYVANNYEGYAGNIVEFTPSMTGNVPPMRSITDNAHVFDGVAVDSNNALYVLRGTLDATTGFVTGAQVAEYDLAQSGAAPPRAVLGGGNTGLGTASSIQIDQQNNLYVNQRIGSGSSAAQQLLIFGPYVTSAQVPAVTISGFTSSAQFLQFAIR